jgi:hypothetical protein
MAVMASTSTASSSSYCRFCQSDTWQPRQAAEQAKMLLLAVSSHQHQAWVYQAPAAGPQPAADAADVLLIK